MAVMVGYASAYGSTRGVAERIAARLEQHGFEATVRAVHEIGDLEGFEATVVGSAIHNGAWLPEAVELLHRNGDALRHQAVWMFSVSSVGDTGGFFSPRVNGWLRKARGEPKQLQELRERVRPIDHRHFAGAIQPGGWSLLGRAMMRLFGGRYGDHRDWDDIERWADGIAERLAPGSATREGGSREGRSA